MFPNELPSLPPPHVVEFQIDLILGTAPIAKASNRLALAFSVTKKVGSM